MNRIDALAAHPTVRPALAEFSETVDQLIDLTIAIQQIPAPTFAEAARAAFIREQFQQIGLVDVQEDDLHNVYGRYPLSPQTAQAVVISAHSDTVFPAGTDLTVTRNGQSIAGPGIGDNSAGVAGIIHLAKSLLAHQIGLPVSLWFVSNVGEEGLGDLRGMRAVVDRFGAEAAYIVVEGGLYGQISYQAIGVKRYRIEVRAAGGHSWGSFGRASAIHELGRLITAITSLRMPQNPKTTFNVGVIEGGTSINTIAQSASMLLDLRSESPDALRILVEQVEALVAQAIEQAQARGQTDVSICMTQIGDRPAGRLRKNAALVRWADAALRSVGCRQPSHIASSTDANIPLSRGMAAVCVGLTESNHAHRLDEYLDVTHLPQGMQQLLLLTLAAAGFTR